MAVPKPTQTVPSATHSVRMRGSPPGIISARAVVVVAGSADAASAGARPSARPAAAVTSSVAGATTRARARRAGSCLEGGQLPCEQRTVRVAVQPVGAHHWTHAGDQLVACAVDVTEHASAAIEAVGDHAERGRSSDEGRHETPHGRRREARGGGVRRERERGEARRPRRREPRLLVLRRPLLSGRPL
eukprot:scaffold106655_cov69-Phaeocystis_antarctica.AAC.2